MAIVTESDLIDQLKLSKEDRINGVKIENIYQRVVKMLVMQIERIVDSFKEKLPSKANRRNWPHIIWVSPVQHRNFNFINNKNRDKFTTCLDEEVKHHKWMSSLQLKQTWDADDRSLVSAERNIMTATGLRKFWQAVDKTIKYCDIKKFKSVEAAEDRLLVRQATSQHSGNNDGNNVPTEATSRFSRNRDVTQSHSYNRFDNGGQQRYSRGRYTWNNYRRY